MMDVLKIYEGTQQSKYFKRYGLWKLYTLSIWDKKSNNKNHDYIANSQCCGLYSYEKRSKNYLNNIENRFRYLKSS